jgi:putative tricarboxylic transport membrane protein
MVLGICVFIGGWRLGFGEWKDPGPGFMAVLSGLLIFFLSALWLAMTLLKKWGIDLAKKFFSESDSYKRVILIILALVFYTFLLNIAGFMISTFIFLVFLFRMIEPQRWRLAIVVALIVTIISVFVFQFWLGVQLPEGPFSLYVIKKWIY